MRWTTLALCVALLLCIQPGCSQQTTSEVPEPQDIPVPADGSLDDAPDLEPAGTDVEPPDDSASPVLDPEPEPTEQHSEEPAPTEQASDAEQETAGGGGWLAWIVGLVILAAAGYFFSGVKSRPKPTAVLITGPSLSGKTTIYYTLKDGSVQNGTTVSMVENHSTFRLHKADEDSEECEVIDFPGEPQLSARLPDFFPISKAVLFVIDAHNKGSIEQYAAEQMYKLLTHPVIADNQPPILICCNKSDHLSSITLFSKWQLLKKLMEEEITKLIQTQAADDSRDQDDEGKEEVSLGVPGEPFSFDEHSPCPVEFINCSATQGDGMEAVMEFCLQN